MWLQNCGDSICSLSVILIVGGVVSCFYYLLLCIVRPFAAFGVLVFLSLMIWLSGIPFLGGLSMLVGVGIVFVSVWAVRLLARKTRLILLREFWLFAGLLLGIGLSTLVNWGGPAGLGSTFTYVQLLLLAVLVVNFTSTPSQLRRLGYLFILASSLIALVMLLDQAGILPAGVVRSVQSVIMFGGDYDRFERSGGIWGDPNFTALQLLVALPFILEFWGGASHRQKAMLALSGGIILWALRYTYSMGGMVGLAVILLLKTFFLGKRNFIVLATQITLTGLVAWWLVLNFLPEYYWARILVNLDMFRGLLTNNDPWFFLKLGTTRGDTWTAALWTFVQSPVWGHGPGNSVYLNPSHSVFHSYLPMLGAHNFLLTVANDLGLVDLLLFIALLFSALWACWPKHHIDRSLEPIRNAIFIALVSSVVQGLAIDMQSQKLLWVLLGMALVISHLSKITETEERLTTETGTLQFIKKLI